MNRISWEMLISWMNKIQAALSLVSDADFKPQLPQIVVVGSQSVGKSSVLDSIIGWSCLPRGTGIVTRCPIIIQLIKVKSAVDLPMYKGMKPDELPETMATAVAEFPHLPEGKRYVTDADFDTIPDIINEEVQERTHHEKAIITKELLFRIYSPDVVTLTLVDLPGIVKVTVKGQQEGMIEEINDMIHQYIANPNAIILAVSSGALDAATSDALACAKKVDPDHERTMAVFTKLDAKEEGQEQQIIDLLEGKQFEKIMKLGIVGVVNRNAKETEEDMTIKEAHKKEQQWFNQKLPTIAEKHGVGALRDRLQRTLARHIQAVLPGFSTNLKERKRQAVKDLEVIGDSEPKDHFLFMFNIIQDVCQRFSSELEEGPTDEDVFSEICARAKIIEFLENKLEAAVPPVELKAQEILTVIQNKTALDAVLTVPEPAFKDLAKLQMKKLAEPAKECAEDVRSQLVTLMEKCLKSTPDLGRFSRLRAQLAAEIADLLDMHHQNAVEEIEKYIKRNAAFIKTRNKDFKSVSQEFCPREDSEEQLKYLLELAKKSELLKPEADGFFEKSETADLTKPQLVQCYAVLILVTKYYQNRVIEFLEYIPKVVLGNLADEVMETMFGALVSKLNGKVKEVMVEDDGIAEQRKRLQNLVQSLAAAERVLREVEGAAI